MTQSKQGQFWDERYRESGFSFGEAPNAFLAAQRALFKVGMRALVPGDGEGRNGVWLAELGLNVTTVDASAIGVHKAKILAAERGVTIDAHEADLETWTWPKAEFDVVASIYLHFPQSQRERMHGRMLTALKPGGVMILEGYSLRQLVYRAAGSVGGPMDYGMLFEPRDIAKDFRGANILRLEEERVTLDEGKRHRGASAVVRMIAKLPEHP
jgi:2-polyprenyl-3-methyl-5-hydroxy-6-metoxy-1,4-benzoquinol methylase